MPRELSHHSTKFTFPIQLQGKSVIKSPSARETLGRWDNLINQKTSERQGSPDRVVKRTQDNKLAKRTIQPHLNTENEKPQNRRIKTQSCEAEPGSIMVLLKKSGTIKDINPGSKKTFKEKGKAGETMYSQTPKVGLRVSTKKLEAYSSHISTLGSPVYTESAPTTATFRDENGFRSSSPGLASASLKRKQFHMRSAIGILSNGDDTKRDYMDIDERKILQSANSPRIARHLECTFQNQPTPMTEKVLPRKDPNRVSTQTYDETGNINPLTRGKKTSYREHTERNISTAWTPATLESFSTTTSPKYGGMEPLNALFSGRRAQSPKANFNNVIAEPPSHKDNTRGSTVFSYRTYSSQIIF